MPENELEADESRALGRLRTKKETVSLDQFVDRRKQMEVTELFGTLEPDADYSYKKERNTRAASGTD